MKTYVGTFEADGTYRVVIEDERGESREASRTLGAEEKAEGRKVRAVIGNQIVFRAFWNLVEPMSSTRVPCVGISSLYSGSQSCPI